ncbi:MULTISPECIES: sodium/proline symporter [Bacillus]|nr:MULTISPECIES: sodium/proline symporter [Bacillus]HWO78252.1 sodium/proline symporter [Bacillus sp. (in: firmicutes)]MDU0070722.1 sodium/proline symporter [Bacillus sp. IG6]MED8018706.1 sodium/proline symporter [Bacillus glycinifermentans]WKB75852.1 sodium/proline symporter [Bacillus glycinifermentans]SCA86868.1 sodium/proline symporter family protein [Bacillus glycinifermentans]
MNFMGSTIVFIEIIVYIILMLLVGVYFSRKDLNHADYFLGGNKLPGWALAFSERATGESAYMFLGAVGFIYVSGLSGVWILSGMFLGILFSWLVLAKIFMKETKKYGVYTLTDYIAVRFPKHSNVIRWLSSIIMVFFFTCYLAAQFSGVGKTLYSFSGLNITVGSVIIAVIIIAYSCMGGFMSVVWTDTIQSFLMLISFIIVPIAGFIEIRQNNLSISTALSSMGNGADNWFGGFTGVALGAMLFTNLSWFFGWLGGQPQLSSRFMALRDKKELRTGQKVAIVWTLIVYVGAFLSAIFASVLYKQGEVADSEMILPHMVYDLLPHWVAGIIISGILAAIMSTASSQLLVITTSVSEDIIHKAMGITIKSTTLVKLSRFVVIVSGVVGIVISLASGSIIYNIVSFAWAGVGNTFSAVILLTFFWKKTSGAGVIATIIIGFVSSILWTISPLEAIVSAKAATFFICLIGGIIVSLCYPENRS